MNLFDCPRVETYKSSKDGYVIYRLTPYYTRSRLVLRVLKQQFLEPTPTAFKNLWLFDLQVVQGCIFVARIADIPRFCVIGTVRSNSIHIQ